MASSAKARGEVLRDSEATLRQVEGVLSDFGDTATGALSHLDEALDRIEQKPLGLQDLIRMLVQTYGEIMEVIDSLRRSRGLLEQAAMERLQTTHRKIEEVSSATEMAATGMLDGLDRALVLLDHLEAAADRERDDASSAAEIRGELRNELHQVMDLLQFQDITSQQLGYASGVLLDIEERMLRLARLFDLKGISVERDVSPGSSDVIQLGPEKDHGHCDPEASTLDAESRQALADEIFTAG